MQGGLLEHNPASHLIWWVGGVALVLVALVIAVDVVLDWRSNRVPGPKQEGSEDPPYRLARKQSWLRQRYLRRITSSWRTLRSSSANRKDQ